MKIPIAAQITEAERNRDRLAEHVGSKPELEPLLDRAEAIVLTLRWLQVYEPDFRQYMRDRSARSE